MNFDTRRWLVTSIAGFICLGAWLGASTTNPIFVFPDQIKAMLLMVALGSLGLAQWTGYKAVTVLDEVLRSDEKKP